MPIIIRSWLTIRDKNNDPKYVFSPTNGTKKGNLLQTTDAWITGYNVPGSTLSGSVNFNFRLLNLGFQNKTAVGSQDAVRSIPLTIKVNSSGVLTDCQNSAQGDDPIWIDLADMNGIYYNSGGVIIGDTSDGTIANGPSLSVGTNNQVTKISSAAIGQYNNVDASGSVALGASSIANTTRGSGGSVGPIGAIAIGTGAQALSPQSVAFGYSATTSQRFGATLATNSQNHGHGATVIGQWNAAGNPAVDNDTGDGFGQGGGAHGLNVFGNGNGNPCTVSPVSNTSYLMGYYSTVIGNENQSTNNAIMANIFGNNLRADARGAMLLGDSSLSKGQAPLDPANPCGQSTTNSTRDSLMARFAGGYRLHVEKTVDPNVGVFIKNNPTTTPAANKAWMGINLPNPTDTRYALEVAIGETKLKQEDWKVVTYATGWGPCYVNSNPKHVMYFKDSVGMVHLKGCLSRTGAPFTNLNVAFSVPAGYIPETFGQYIGPLHRRQEFPNHGHYWPRPGEYCYLYFHGVGTFAMLPQSVSTTWPTGDGCDLISISWRAEG